MEIWTTDCQQGTKKKGPIVNSLIVIQPHFFLLLLLIVWTKKKKKHSIINQQVLWHIKEYNRKSVRSGKFTTTNNEKFVYIKLNSRINRNVFSRENSENYKIKQLMQENNSDAFSLLQPVHTTRNLNFLRPIPGFMDIDQIFLARGCPCEFRSISFIFSTTIFSVTPHPLSIACCSTLHPSLIAFR